MIHPRHNLNSCSTYFLLKMIELDLSMIDPIFISRNIAVYEIGGNSEVSRVKIRVKTVISKGKNWVKSFFLSLYHLQIYLD